MKFNQSENGPVRGSFGLPPEMKEAVEKAKAEKKETPEPVKAEEVQQQAQVGVTDDDAQKADPMQILKGMGVEFNDTMFNQLLFKGFVEADLEVIGKKFIARIRTLTTEEYDMVDELLAEDVKTKQMTNDGFDTRRSMWVMAFGVTHLMGKPVCPVVVGEDKKTVDKVATAKKRRAVLSGLAPIVINTLIQKHAAMTVAINMIVSSPGEHIKNS